MGDAHLEESLRRILAAAILQDVADPRVGFVTVSEVRLNRDNTVAQVFYTVLGDDEERARSLSGLKSCKGFLRQRIGDELRLRTLPDLRFRYDDSLDRSYRLESLMDSEPKPEPGDDA